jgi:uncharacterized membrane protein (Fun14 family)
VNTFLRDNGFGVALALGVGLLVFGLATGNLAALVIAIVLLVIGVSARPLEQFTLSRSKIMLSWQREAVERLQRRFEELVEERLTMSNSPEATVIRGGATAPDREIITADVGAGRDEVLSRAESPDEFAETVIEQVIEPTLVRVFPPTAKLGLKTPTHAESDTRQGG